MDVGIAVLDTGEEEGEDLGSVLGDLVGAGFEGGCDGLFVV